MAIATTSFTSYGGLTGSAGSIDLDTLSLASSFGELYSALSSVDNDTLLGGTEISGPFPGGRFTAIGGFFNRSGAIRAMDLFWSDAQLHADVAVVVKRNGAYAGFVTQLSYETPQLSFALDCRATAGGNAALITHLTVEVGEGSYEIRGKVTLNLNNGKLSGTISSMQIDDGLHHATLTKLNVPVAQFMQKTGAEALPFLLSHNDVLSASANSVALSGFAGKDAILGSSGDDTLSGGTGSDKLIGGRGADQFLFDVAPRGGANADVIVDFAQSEGDRIVLDGAIFTSQPFVAVHRLKDKLDIDGAAFDSASYVGLVYETFTGKLYYDTDAAAGGERIATLTGKPELSADGILFLPSA